MRCPLSAVLAASIAVTSGSGSAEDRKVSDLQTETLILRARGAAAKGQYDKAINEVTAVIKVDGKNVEALLLRGELYAATREHTKALADLDEVLKLDPKQGRALDKRGEERFKIGRFKDSVEDFDKAIELGARREREHWQRGISHYYAAQFDKGQKQFEAYQTFEDNDVENAVWRYLCMAKAVGGRKGLEKARDDLLRIRRDRRVPMMEVYDLYAGKL